MEKDFAKLFTDVKEVLKRYELDETKVNQALEEIPGFQVTVPLVGGFSTGKSSLINTVLGENLLPTNISAETAVPTEIVYGNDTVTLVKGNEDGLMEETIPLSEFDSKVLSADTHSLVRIYTSNDFFRQIPTVKLVDMPGFDSGIEVHNRAIDQYLPKSLAYILAVAADEGTLRESIISFLNELKIYNMPVYAVITKRQKVTAEQLEETRAHITDTIRRFLKVEDVKVAVTNAKGKEITVDGFRDILFDLQERSKDIYDKTFSNRLGLICAEVEKYLCDRLNQSDMSLEQIKLEKDRLMQNIGDLEQQFSDEQARFNEQIPQCVAGIKNKIAQDLNASASVIESMILQGTDVTEKINFIIRNAISKGIQSELEPRLQKYMRKVSDAIQATIYGDTSVQLDSSTIKNDEKIGNALQGALIPVATVLTDIAFTALASTSLAATMGLTGSILGPIGAAVGALAGTLISVFINKNTKKKQERERKELAHQKVKEVIESVTIEACNKVETEITEYVANVNEQVKEDINKKKELLEKALEDTEEKLNFGKQEKEQEQKMLQNDLDKIREIKDGI